MRENYRHVGEGGRKTHEDPGSLADSTFMGDKFLSVGLPFLWIPVEEIKY